MKKECRVNGCPKHSITMMHSRVRSCSQRKKCNLKKISRLNLNSVLLGSRSTHDFTPPQKGSCLSSERRVKLCISLEFQGREDREREFSSLSSMSFKLRGNYIARLLYCVRAPLGFVSEYSWRSHFVGQSLGYVLLMPREEERGARKQRGLLDRIGRKTQKKIQPQKKEMTQFPVQMLMVPLIEFFTLCLPES